TDSYGIGLGSVTNFEVAGNTVIPINGRGLYLDGKDSSGNAGGSLNGNIHDNHFEAREGPNLEYPYYGMEATALRVRNGTMQNIVFRNNTSAAYTGVGLDWAAIGARINDQNNPANTLGNNPGSDMLFENNIFQGIVTQADPSYTGTYASHAWAVSLGRIDPGTGLTFRGNTFESNVTSLNFGDSDSAGSFMGNNALVQDVGFLSNTILKSSAGDQTLAYHGIVAGDWGNNVHDIRLIDMRYQGGATPGVTFLGNQPKDVEVGWLLNLSVVDGLSNPIAAANVQVL